jgi:hypothetical protein
MRAKLEVLLLVLALGAVGAFVVSFALGWRPRAASTPAATNTTIARNPTPPAVANRLVRVEVLNASGKPGIARVATDKLRDAGFDVVYFGNAPGAVRRTSTVIDRGGKLEAARSMAAALEIVSVQSAPDNSRQVDASVLLGADWPDRQRSRRKD